MTARWAAAWSDKSFTATMEFPIQPMATPRSTNRAVNSWLVKDPKNAINITMALVPQKAIQPVCLVTWKCLMKDAREAEQKTKAQRAPRA